MKTKDTEVLGRELIHGNSKTMMLLMKPTEMYTNWFQNQRQWQVFTEPDQVAGH